MTERLVGSGNPSMRAGLATIAAVALCWIAVPAGAEASTIRMTENGLVIDARQDGDARDSLTISVDTRTAEGQIARWKITSLFCGPPGGGAPCMSAGAGCQLPGPGEPGFGTPIGSFVTCDRTAAGVTVLTGGGNDQVAPLTERDAVNIDLGAGNDTVRSVLTGANQVPSARWVIAGGSGNDTIQGSAAGNSVTAGSGNDRIKAFPLDQFTSREIRDRPELSGDDSINGGSGNDRIDGGAGEDQLIGGGGDDRFNMRGENSGGDAVDGGTGFDRIDYSQRTANLFFNSGATESGSPGARDRVSRMEHVILGSGNDVVFSLVLNDDENLARRRYEGRNGNDDLRGGASNDVIVGGGGRDRLQGGSGDDVLDARDNGRDERISCGPGRRDIARLDTEDPDPDPPSACETITRR